MYSWQGYDYALLNHYKDGTDSTELAEKLREVVQKVEDSGEQSPPGLYADFAFALYESGQVDEALVYFEKEKEQWPESERFLTAVMGRISGSSD